MCANRLAATGRRQGHVAHIRSKTPSLARGVPSQPVCGTAQATAKGLPFDPVAALLSASEKMWAT